MDWNWDWDWNWIATAGLFTATGATLVLAVDLLLRRDRLAAVVTGGVAGLWIGLLLHHLQLV